MSSPSTTESSPSAAAPSRSWLFTPGSREQRFPKAEAAGADVVIFDLEDAVPPDQKSSARGAVLRHLETPAPPRVQRAVRINGLRTRYGLEDLLALLQSAADPDFVILPKAESPDEIRLLGLHLRDAGKSTRIVALVESAAGLIAAPSLPRVTHRVAGLFFGAADFASDIDAEGGEENLAGARSLLVLAAAAAQVLAIDTPYFDLENAAGMAAAARGARALGFGAKAAIHPSQVGPINEAFTPKAAEIERARRIVEAAAQGVAVVEGKMIDEAMARKARRILAMAEQLERV